MKRTASLIPLAILVSFSSAAAQQLSAAERQMKTYIEQHRADQEAFLQRAVDIPSGTLNVAGVRKVGALFSAALDSLGFKTRWIEMPAEMKRAGHLVAEHTGKAGTKRILLIGHFDTVFEGAGQNWVREDTTARGAGSSDMKGGDAIIIYALKAMQAAGQLKDANITVVFTGDEESAGDPLSISRRDLIDAAKRSDAALAFEGGSKDNATVARRGASTWVLKVAGKQGHSSGVFSNGAGYGAIYELARILDTFRTTLAGQQYLTFNVGAVVGGTDVSYDSARIAGTAAGKTNIIARSAWAQGDLRFITQGQLDSARAVMRDIVAKNLAGTSAEISFQDEYPAMSPTPGNYALLATYDTVSQALGYGKVDALDPGRRGAGDASFVAPYVDALDGLGADGRGSHSPDERVNLNSLPMQTERAALAIARMSRERKPAQRP